MEVGDLYNFVLILVLVGLLIGIGMVVLGSFAGTAVFAANKTATGCLPAVCENLTGGAGETALNSTVTALGTIPSTWLPLIVTISVLGIILTLVIRSFGQNR